MAAENNAVPPAGCKLPAAGFLGRLHVLVVDDDAAYLEDLKIMLLLSGYSVTGKTTAEEALQELEQNPEYYFDIVMTDVQMPGMDGFDLLHRVKGRLPVIMFSESEDVVMVMRAILDGACDYMMKPITSEAIKIIWKHVLRRRLSDLPTRASSLPRDRLAVALAAMAPSPPPTLWPGDDQEVVFPQPPAPKENINVDVQEAAKVMEAALLQPPLALVPDGNGGGDVQEASLVQPPVLVVAGNMCGDVQEVALAQHPAPASVGNKHDDILEAVVVAISAGSSHADGQETVAKKRGVPEVSDMGSNNFEPKEERKKAKLRFIWTRETHSVFVNAYYQLKDKKGPKRIKQLMELEGIFVTKAQISSHLQKYRCWLETTKNQEEGHSTYNQLSNSIDHPDICYSTAWKKNSIIREGPLSKMFSSRPVHSMVTSTGRFSTTQSNYVGVGPKEIENFISSHHRSQGTAIGHGSAIRHENLCYEATSGRYVHGNGSSQVRGNAMNNGTSASHGVAITNENLLQVIRASLPSNMGQQMQPSQSLSKNDLAANFSAVSDQNPRTSYKANSSATHNQNPVTQEISVRQPVEVGYGNNVMLDWPELGGLDDQLDNDTLMNSLSEVDQLKHGVITVTDGTQEISTFGTTGDFSSLLSEGLNNEIPNPESTSRMNGTHQL
uniref:Response regulatory domain-containing protein n=1 Tax=Oryza punctata TaxID=4537 RepID=A0A0E0L274_ORYPU